MSLKESAEKDSKSRKNALEDQKKVKESAERALKNGNLFQKR